MRINQADLDSAIITFEFNEKARLGDFSSYLKDAALVYLLEYTLEEYLIPRLLGVFERVDYTLNPHDLNLITFFLPNKIVIRIDIPSLLNSLKKGNPFYLESIISSLKKEKEKSLNRNKLSIVKEWN